MGGIADEQELAGRLAAAPEDHFGLAGAPRFDKLADHGRNDMRRLQIEVVARAVEIDREQGDGRKPELLPVGLGLHEQHLLRHAIGCVGLLRIAVPEIVFFERNRRELGVGADRPDRDKLTHAGKPSLFH